MIISHPTIVPNHRLSTSIFLTITTIVPGLSDINIVRRAHLSPLSFPLKSRPDGITKVPMIAQFPVFRFLVGLFVFFFSGSFGGCFFAVLSSLSREARAQSVWVVCRP